MAKTEVGLISLGLGLNSAPAEKQAEALGKRLRGAFESMGGKLGEAMSGQAARGTAALENSLRGVRSALDGVSATLSGTVTPGFLHFMYGIAAPAIRLLDRLIDRLAATARALRTMFGMTEVSDAEGALEDVTAGAESAGAAVMGVGSAVSGAAAEIKRSLMGFDEINKLMDETAAGAGGAASAVGSAGGGGAGADGSGIDWNDFRLPDTFNWPHEYSVPMPMELTPEPEVVSLTEEQTEALRERLRQVVRDKVAEAGGVLAKIPVNMEAEAFIQPLPDAGTLIDLMGRNVLDGLGDITVDTPIWVQPDPDVLPAPSTLAPEVLAIVEESVRDLQIDATVKLGVTPEVAMKQLYAEQTKIPALEIKKAVESAMDKKLEAEPARVTVPVAVGLGTVSDGQTSGQLNVTKALEPVEEELAEADYSAMGFTGIAEKLHNGLTAALAAAFGMQVGAAAEGGLAAAFTIDMDARMRNLYDEAPEEQKHIGVTGVFGSTDPTRLTDAQKTVSATAKFDKADTALLTGDKKPWSYATAWFNAYGKKSDGEIDTNYFKRPWSYGTVWYNAYGKNSDGEINTSYLTRPWSYGTVWYNKWSEWKISPWSYGKLWYNAWEEWGIEPWSYATAYFNSFGASSDYGIAAYMSATPWAYAKAYFDDYDTAFYTPPVIKCVADITSVNALDSTFLSRAVGGVYASGAWRPIEQYASGGIPGMGQLFVAREAGPELVGTLGGHTAVMNNDQIVASVSAGVARALSGMKFYSQERYTPQLAMIGGSVTRGGERLEELARRASEAAEAGGVTQVIVLLREILEAIRALDLDIELDGESVKDKIVRLINRRTQATGVCEIVV